MLSLEDITLEVGEGDEVRRLLAAVSLRMHPGQFIGVIGPSGCGKSTLLKVIAGLMHPTEGIVRWNGRDLASEGDLAPAELGYVPQFSLSHDLLTVRECVEYAARLRVDGAAPEERAAHVESLLAMVGLDALADRPARVLSGGQRRRLSLAIETVSSPSLLLGDEVTSGLDPGSAHEIMKLLHAQSRAEGGARRIVVNVTHSLADMEMYDRIVVLYGGCLVYDAAPKDLAHYFRAETPDGVYARLALREPTESQASWFKHGPYFYQAEEAARQRAHATTEPEAPEELDPTAEAGTAEVVTPGRAAQFATLLERRLRLFARDRTQLALQLGLILGFPCLVVIFALNGLPAIRNLSLANDQNIVEQLHDSVTYMQQAFDVGGLVSGLLLFQIILLALMGSNNSALEIAGERLRLESEKLAGLSTAAYVASKCAFLALLVTAQAFWMGIFVHWICRFPGDLFGQIGLLWLVDAALTAVCLAFSSLARTPSQASLVSIYFVGFQLPLSGAVLALPQGVSGLTRPFIAAYWSWSGLIQTMRQTRFYDLIATTTKTDLANVPACVWVLGAQVALGVGIAYLGCKRSSWD